MSPNKILLVEDDDALGFVTKDNLEGSGFQVTWARDGQEAELLLEKASFDIVILDVMLPKQDGFTLARKIRGRGLEVPILFLSAKSLLEDRLEGLRLGGDDYLTKPFSLEELLLKIKVFLNRSGKSREERHSYKIGSYLFYPKEMRLENGKNVTTLTRKEALVLEMFCRNPDEVLKREEILNAIWGNDDYFLGRSLDVFISKLRKHLKQDPTLSITNFHGVGFKLEVQN